MTDAEILTLVDRLERCLLGKEEFHHRDHLAVAVVYLYSADIETAMDRMRASLQRFAAHHGVTGLYHETLTRFWLRQVEIGKERIGHGHVVMLAGVDHERLKLARTPFHRGDNRRHLHEIRPRADDVYDFEHVNWFANNASHRLHRLT